MKKVYINIFICLSVCFMTACSGWLDIEPEGQATNNKLTETGDGYRTMLSGVYKAMTSKNLYGVELQFGIVDCMSRQYTWEWMSSTGVSSSSIYQKARDFNYYDVNLRETIDAIWKDGYNVIANANNLIQNIKDEDPNKFAEGELERDMILGEAYACRALMHFDLCRLFAPAPIEYDWFNYALSAAATYKLTKQFGFTGDFTYITQHPRIENFAPATTPNTDKISVPLGRVGIYYNNDWLSLTSLFSYISKTNNNSTLNLQHAVNGVNQIMAAPLTYDIKTLGWTTDVVATPFKGFDLHFLFTYQKPTYKKYETSVTFPDGYVGSINATGNIVAEIPQVIVEIDPSYMITKDLKIWTSFRYFSKTYANINDAYYFNGRWETFGGLNWQVNKKLSLGCTVVNFLNQTGAKGSIAGAELIEKEDAGQYAGHVMAGSYIRPFTVEFSAQLKF